MAGKSIGVTIAFFMFVAGITVLFGSWYTIDQTERGVILTNGAIVGEAEPGLHFKAPLIMSVVKISNQQVVSRWICTPENICDADHDAQLMQGYSQDQQPADLRVSVNWHVPADRVKEVYEVFGGIESLASRIIFRKVPQEVKTVFGRFNAVSVIRDRQRFNAEVLAAVQASITGPIVVDSVQVENIDFSDAYEQSVEARMKAEVDVQKREQELKTKQIDAQITVIEAQARADSNLAVAKANAEAIRISGDATADAIRARAAALSDNPLLVQLTAVERWDGRMPTTMPPNGAVPFVNIPSSNVVSP